MFIQFCCKIEFLHESEKSQHIGVYYRLERNSSRFIVKNRQGADAKDIYTALVARIMFTLA